MQETFDFYTLIIIITFLGTLLFLAFFINKKKDFFKSKLIKIDLLILLVHHYLVVAIGNYV